MLGLNDIFWGFKEQDFDVYTTCASYRNFLDLITHDVMDIGLKLLENSKKKTGRT